MRSISPIPLRDAIVGTPRVLFLAECPTPQRNVVFDALDDSKLRPLVVYMEPGGHNQGWGAQRFSHRHLYADGKVALTILALLWLVARNRKDLIVASFGVRRPVRLAALLAARILRVPVVVRSDTNFMMLEGEPLSRRVLRRLYWRLLLPGTTRVWAISDSNAKFWSEEMRLRNILKIPYSMPALPGVPADFPRPRESDPQKMRFLYVGRLAREKRVDLLVSAFTELEAEAHRDWELVIVGDGEQRSGLEAQASQDPRIRFVGAVPHAELAQYFDSSDVLVLPSSREPWGLVVNEALGFGLWVIVSNRVGAVEAITDGLLGVAFESGDRQHLRKCLEASVNHLQRTPVPLFNPTYDMRRDLLDMLGDHD